MLPVSLAMLLMTMLLESADIPLPPAGAGSRRRTGRHCQWSTCAQRPPPDRRVAVRSLPRPEGSGPELAFQHRGGLLERAGIGPGGQVLPATVGDDEHDVGAPAGGDLLVGDAERRVQDRAGRDAGEDA